MTEQKPVAYCNSGGHGHPTTIEAAACDLEAFRKKQAEFAAENERLRQEREQKKK